VKEGERKDAFRKGQGWKTGAGVGERKMEREKEREKERV